MNITVHIRIIMCTNYPPSA